MKLVLRVLAIALVVTVSVWLSSRDRTGLHQFTGSVVDWQEGRSISVARPMDPVAFQFTLRDTIYDGDPRAIRQGARVTVWYKSVGEQYWLASRVHVLSAANK